MAWFLLAPLIGAALGAGGAKATGRDWKKGAMLGAGLGLGAGALPLVGGASTGGAAGWSSLLSGTTAPTGGSVAAAKAASAWQPNAFGKLLGTAGRAATGKGLAADAVKSAAVSGTLNTVTPQYGQTHNLVDPGFMAPPPDAMAELQALMQKRRI